MEYLKHVLGTQAESDLFEGIDLSWKRASNGDISSQIDLIIKNFNPSFPENSVEDLLALRKSINKVKDDFWRSKKIKEVDDLIIQCVGLFIEATATKPTVVPDDSLQINLELVNRTDMRIAIKSVIIDGEDRISAPIVLSNNQKQIEELGLLVSSTKEYSGPYWLVNQPTLGMYAVEDQLLRGTPKNIAAYNVSGEIEIAGTNIPYHIPVEYKWTDRVVGESYRPLVVVPPVVASFDDPVLIFDNGKAQKIGVNITANHKLGNAKVRLDLPSTWKSVPEEISIDVLNEGVSNRFEFEVFPSNSESSVHNIKIITHVDGKDYSKSMQTIAYEHIPYQVMLPEASAKAVSLHVAVAAKTVGYIMGAGDAVPQALEQMGVKVWLMNESDITSENLVGLDAVILGVRALNTEVWLKNKKEVLLNYVSQGGTMITQYNTTRRMAKWDNFAPFSLSFDGGSAGSRVAEENAEVIIKDQSSIILNYPNAITSKDFDGWVQERGLYFPSDWDENYTAPLAMQDIGEKVHNGSLLVAEYGKGHYVYTGLSFFRELPAGVPGAYRLFANIISLSSNPNSNLKSK